MGKMSRMFVVICCAIFLAFMTGGCGEDTGNDASEVGSSVSSGQRDHYDLTAEEWKAYEEIIDSDDMWSVSGYWDDLASGVAAMGMERIDRYTVSEGQNFYILVSEKELEGQRKQFYYLTQIDMLSLKSKRIELDLRATGSLTSLEASKLAVLADALDQGQAELAGLDASGGKLSLFVCRWADGRLEGIYSLQLGTDGSIEGMTDLLPGLAQAGTLSENRKPTDLIRDIEGNYFVMGSSKGGEICVLDEKGEFLAQIEISGNQTGIYSCTGKLLDGRPIFEYMDPETGALTIFYFDGNAEKILYRGRGSSAAVRYINGSGEIIWLDYSGILRWNAVKGSCERFYQDNGLNTLSCEAIFVDGEGNISIACCKDDVTSLFLLSQGAEEQTQVRIFQLLEDAQMKEIAAQYSRKHPGTQIVVETCEPGADKTILLNRLMAQVTSGSGPDILVVNRNQMEILQDKGVLAELSQVLPEEIREQIFGSVLRQGTIKNDLYGISRQVSISTLLVPQKVWEGETWSFRDVLDLLDEGERRDEPLDRFISVYSSLTADQMFFDLALLDVEEGTSSFLDMEQGKCFFDTPEFIRLLEVCKKYGEAPDARKYMTDEERFSEVEDGRALSYSVGGDLKAFSYAMAMCGEDYQCVGYPTEGACGSRVTCYQFAVVNANTKNYDAAADFLNFILSGEIQREYGTSTVRRDILTEGVVERPGNSPVFMHGEKSIIELEGKPDGSSYLQEYVELLDTGVPETWMMTELRSIIMEEAAAFFNGDKSAKDAAVLIQNKVQLYLDEG